MEEKEILDEIEELNVRSYPLICKTKAQLSKQKEIYVEVKPAKRRGKCFGAPVVETKAMSKQTQAEQLESTQPYLHITNDIWFLISEYIPPEDVQSFALICSQTAAIVNTCKFWKQLYISYCQKTSNSKIWNLQLPEHLQLNNILHCDAKYVRCRVIESLFHCHKSLIERLKHGYQMDALVGLTYVASWHMPCECSWMMCFKFWNRIKQNKNSFNYNTSNADVLNDWEILALSDGAEKKSKFVNPNEGISLLVICCNQFIPFPAQLLYGSDEEARIRLSATRQLLTKNMCAFSLELDFINVINKNITTMKYPEISKYKVLPWWHPDFKKFNK